MHWLSQVSERYAFLTAHDYAHAGRLRKSFRPTPDLPLAAQMVCRQQAMPFLSETGGRLAWTNRKS